jgi:hypothetical protein
MDRQIDKCLRVLKNWAEQRIASGTEPPWAWYQYMKLIETVAAIQSGRAVVAPATVDSAARPRAESGVKADEVTRRRRRREDPPLPM